MASKGGPKLVGEWSARRIKQLEKREKDLEDALRLVLDSVLCCCSRKHCPLKAARAVLMEGR